MRATPIAKSEQRRPAASFKRASTHQSLSKCREGLDGLRSGAGWPQGNGHVEPSALHKQPTMPKKPRPLAGSAGQWTLPYLLFKSDGWVSRIFASAGGCTDSAAMSSSTHPNIYQLQWSNSSGLSTKAKKCKRLMHWADARATRTATQAVLVQTLHTQLDCQDSRSCKNSRVSANSPCLLTQRRFNPRKEN